jgi:hypothetical protein
MNLARFPNIVKLQRLGTLYEVRFFNAFPSKFRRTLCLCKIFVFNVTKIIGKISQWILETSVKKLLTGWITTTLKIVLDAFVGKPGYKMSFVYKNVGPEQHRNTSLDVYYC